MKCPTCNSENIIWLNLQISGNQYDVIFPKKRHKSVGNWSYKSYWTLVPWDSVFLVRKTISFSKKLSNHIGAIWYFIHHYNANIIW